MTTETITPAVIGSTARNTSFMVIPVADVQLGDCQRQSPAAAQALQNLVSSLAESRKLQEAARLTIESLDEENEQLRKRNTVLEQNHSEIVSTLKRSDSTTSHMHELFTNVIQLLGESRTAVEELQRERLVWLDEKTRLLSSLTASRTTIETLICEKMELLKTIASLS